MRRSAGRRGDWLSPEAYDALSPAEKRAVWLERKRQPRRHRRGPDGRRQPSRAALAIAAVLVAGAAAWQIAPTFAPSDPLAAASAASERSASFGLCHTGGGTNCVVDGDTIWLAGQNIRIADIDAPETHDYRCPQEQALGRRATQRLQALVNSGAITVRSVDRDEDPYGRKLRLVFVDGRGVGDTLVAEGLARYYKDGKRPWC